MSLIVENLNLTFRNKKILDDLSFVVADGAITGLVGASNAGKSMLLKTLAGVIKPDGGVFRHDGRSFITTDVKHKSQVGLLPQGAPIYADVTAYEYLELVHQLRGFNFSEECIDQALEIFSLNIDWHQPIDYLSISYKKCLTILQAILHKPKWILLDEPFAGLDPGHRHQLRTYLKQLATTSSIIFTSHDLDEVSTVSNSLIVLKEGRINRHLKNVDKLANQSATEKYETIGPML